MNAYEMADELQELDSKLHLINLFKSATMLRQQADRIAELEKVSKPVAWMDYLEHSNVYDLNVSGRGIPLYTAPQIKELSDVEISLIAEEFTGADGLDVVDFGRAILKKAREK